MRAAPAADMNAQFAGKWCKATLQRSHDTCGDAGGMPIHSHHRTERLKPERMREPAQQFVTPIVVNDGLADDRPETGHPVGKPMRYTPAMQR
jgi:hypothetical protein